MQRKLIILRSDEERRKERINDIISEVEAKSFSNPQIRDIMIYDISNDYPHLYPGLREEDINKISQRLSIPNLFGIRFNLGIVPGRFYETYLCITSEPKSCQIKEVA